MAVKIGSDGALYCNAVKYNYKQARNLVADYCYGQISGTSVWGQSNVSIKSSYAGYKSYRAFGFKTSGVSMYSQTMPVPIANHKYYGGIMWKTSGSSFSVSDARFEWYHTDGNTNNNLTFANKTMATNGNWIKLSEIVQAGSSPNTGSWQIRNFTVNASTDCMTSKPIIIDLTDTFGSGNEPSKDWCDKNIREWEVFVNYGSVIDAVKYDNASTRYSLPADSAIYNYLSLNSSNEPRDYMISIKGNSSVLETIFSSAATITLNNTYTYYAHSDIEVTPTCHTLQSTDIYFPIAEPAFANNNLTKGTNFNGGGGMGNWRRYSNLTTRSSFTNDSYNYRWDFNNNYQGNIAKFCNLGLVNASSNLTQYNNNNNTSVKISDINKYWCDRWIDARSSSIIHIKDHKNTKVNFTGPMKEVSRTSVYSYTSAQLDSWANGAFDTWGGITNVEELQEYIGQYVFIRFTIRDKSNVEGRFVIKLQSASGNSLTGIDVGYGIAGTDFYEMTQGYFIECNDIEIRPELDKVYYDSTGTIFCKKLVIE